MLIQHWHYCARGFMDDGQPGQDARLRRTNFGVPIALQQDPFQRSSGADGCQSSALYCQPVGFPEQIGISCVFEYDLGLVMHGGLLS